MLDSGAFTAHTKGKRVDLREYSALCKYIGPSLYGYIQLDVLEDAAATARNLDHMVSAGLRPMPVVTIDMPVARAAEVSEVNPRLCVAGASSGRSTRWMIDRINTVVSRCPGAKVHGLAFTPGVSITRSKVATVDSSSHTSGKRYADLHIFCPEQESIVILKTEKMRKLGWKNTPRAIRDGIIRHGCAVPVSRPGRLVRSPVHLIGLFEWLRYAAWLERRGVQLFFASAGFADCAETLAVGYSATNGGRAIDWSSVLSNIKAFKEMSPKELGLVASEVSLNFLSRAA